MRYADNIGKSNVAVWSLRHRIHNVIIAHLFRFWRQLGHSTPIVHARQTTTIVHTRVTPLIVHNQGPLPLSILEWPLTLCILKWTLPLPVLEWPLPLSMPEWPSNPIVTPTIVHTEVTPPFLLSADVLFIYDFNRKQSELKCIPLKLVPLTERGTSSESTAIVAISANWVTTIGIKGSKLKNHSALDG